MLDESNYSLSFSMNLLLKARELWDVIEDEPSNVRARKSTSEGTPEGPQPQRDAVWHKKDQLALSSIVLPLKPAEQEQIYNMQVTAISYKLDWPVVIAFILNGLPEAYHFQDLQARLLDEDKWIQEGDKAEYKSAAFNARYKKPSELYCGHCNKERTYSAG